MWVEEMNRQAQQYSVAWYGTPEGTEALRESILTAPLEFIQFSAGLLRHAPPEIRDAAEARLKELERVSLRLRPKKRRRNCSSPLSPLKRRCSRPRLRSISRHNRPRQ